MLRINTDLHWEFSFFFFNDTATTEIYTLSLHDALPICYKPHDRHAQRQSINAGSAHQANNASGPGRTRSEEHTSELQSPCNLVCRLLLEKKKQMTNAAIDTRSNSIVTLNLSRLRYILHT